MGIRIYQVDAFTAEPFAGNPAAVCIPEGRRDAAWMQNVAREMNLSETAFLCPEGDGYELRWFTPPVEVDLCGHATLASAHTLWDSGMLAPGREARFHTRSGLLRAELEGSLIRLDFPATPPESCDQPQGLLRALGIPSASLRHVARSAFDYLLEVDSEATVRSLSPDFPALRSASSRGVMVTAASASEAHDFVSRFFAPAAGIDEDPVTGSAHCCLGPYWGARLGKHELVGFQASARGGVVRVKLGGERVELAGRAVTVLRGELLNCG